MITTDMKYLLYGAAGFICLIVGGYGLLNKKNIKKPYFYICKNLLLAASTMIPFFFFVTYFRFTSLGRNIMNQSIFNTTVLIWIGLSSFIIGLDGYLKRRLIKNEMHEQIARFQLIVAFIMSIFIVFYLIKWHHF